MTTTVKIPPERTQEFVQHLHELINAIVDVNNELVVRLTSLPDCPPEALSHLKEWRAVIEDILTASNIFVVSLARDGSKRLQ